MPKATATTAAAAAADDGGDEPGAVDRPPPGGLDTPVGECGLVFSSRFDSGNLDRLELIDESGEWSGRLAGRGGWVVVVLGLRRGAATPVVVQPCPARGGLAPAIRECCWPTKLGAVRTAQPVSHTPTHTPTTRFAVILCSGAARGRPSDHVHVHRGVCRCCDCAHTRDLWWVGPSPALSAAPPPSGCNLTPTHRWWS